MRVAKNVAAVIVPMVLLVLLFRKIPPESRIFVGLMLPLVLVLLSMNADGMFERRQNNQKRSEGEE